MALPSKVIAQNFLAFKMSQEGRGYCPVCKGTVWSLVYRLTSILFFMFSRNEESRPIHALDITLSLKTPLTSSRT